MARPSQRLAKGYALAFISIMAYVVHDRQRYATPHSIHATRLFTNLSLDILTHETPDDRNDLITLVLPYVIMAFKVCPVSSVMNRAVLMMSFSIIRTLLPIITSTCHCRGNGSAVILSHYTRFTANIPSSLHVGIPYRR
jgi:hypothetical protein